MTTDLKSWTTISDIQENSLRAKPVPHLGGLSRRPISCFSLKARLSRLDFRPCLKRKYISWAHDNFYNFVSEFFWLFSHPLQKIQINVLGKGYRGRKSSSTQPHQCMWWLVFLPVLMFCWRPVFMKRGISTKFVEAVLKTSLTLLQFSTAQESFTQKHMGLTRFPPSSDGPDIQTGIPSRLQGSPENFPYSSSISNCLRIFYTEAHGPDMLSRRQSTELRWIRQVRTQDPYCEKHLPMHLRLGPRWPVHLLLLHEHGEHPSMVTSHTWTKQSLSCLHAWNLLGWSSIVPRANDLNMMSFADVSDNSLRTGPFLPLSAWRISALLSLLCLCEVTWSKKMAASTKMLKS